jgi:hypothetical protein
MTCRINNNSILLSLLILSVGSTTTTLTEAFVTTRYFSSLRHHQSSIIDSAFQLKETIVSPFDDSQNNSGGDDGDETGSDGTTTTTATKLVGPLDLTWENVEAVLDEMRPFLIQDGGNVAIQDIDGPVVRLELQVNKSLPRTPRSTSLVCGISTFDLTTPPFFFFLCS